MHTLDELKAILTHQGQDTNEFTEHTTWVDLKMDSLEVVEAVMEIEKAFGISIPDQDVEQVKNMGQLLGLINTINI